PFLQSVSVCCCPHAKTRRRKAPRPSSISGSAQDLVLLEPADHAIPGILGRLFAIACPIIGDETVRRTGIDMEFGGLATGFERRFHLMDLIDRNAGIRVAIEAEHRLLYFGGKLDRTLRRGFALVSERTIKGGAGFKLRIVRRVMPDVAAAAAETHDAEPVVIAALRFRPRYCGVEI